jgi:hypothetical protein
VEAPGTAPGSGPLITKPFIAIVRASPDPANIGACGKELKGRDLWRIGRFSCYIRCMTKAAKPKTPEAFRYEPEELEPRDQAADDALIDDFIARNREALIESIVESDAEEARGEGRLLEDVMAELKARRHKRT